MALLTEIIMPISLWNPFEILLASTTAKAPEKDQERSAMPNFSEFEVPSAIMTASLVAKSELTGKDLEDYAVALQRELIRKMIPV
jgi:hypothetical protein